VTAPALSVVIPTHAQRASLGRVLVALAQQTLSDFEVVIAVDGRDPPEDLDGAALPGLRVVTGPPGGPGAARNRGAGVARAEILVFMDDDIVPAPACLAEHLAAHSGGGPEPRVGLGLIHLAAPAERTPWERYLTARYDEHFVKMGRTAYAPTFWDCLSGSLSLPRTLLARAGGFDERFTRHEDVELGYRLARYGARFVYQPRAAAVHCYTRGLSGGLADALGEGSSAGVLLRRHPELAPQLVHARWRRYSPAARAALGRVLRAAGPHARALGSARGWLERVDRSPLPFGLRRPVYQWAYHLHFWQGLRQAAPEWLPTASET
jgi:glycosyltransferase involved in cell wall biosynthesis